MKRRYLIKIIPPEGYGIYRLEFARLHVVALVVLVAVAISAAIGIHYAELSAARVETARLAAVAAEQQAKLSAFDGQTRALSVQLQALQQRNDEIRRAIGIDRDAKRARDDRHAAALEHAPGADAVASRLTALRAVSASTSRDESGLQRLVGRVLLTRRLAAIARSQLLAAIPSINPAGSATIASGFGYRSSPFPEFHKGVDLDADYGSTVFAAAAGTVAQAGWDDGGFGNKVDIDHGNGYHTLYAHLSRVDVHSGERVRKGQRIALVGSTGESTGPHLHYQVAKDGNPVDPAPYLNGVPARVLATLPR